MDHPLNPLTNPAGAIGGFITSPTADIAGADGSLSVMPGNPPALWTYGQNGAQGLFTSTAWTVPSTLTPAADDSFTVILGVSSGVSAAPVVTGIPISGHRTGLMVTPSPITVTTTTNPNGSFYVLDPFLEPSVCSLVGVGLVALLWFRRRASISPSRCATGRM